VRVNIQHLNKLFFVKFGTNDTAWEANPSSYVFISYIQ